LPGDAALKREGAILVGVCRGPQSRAELDEHLEELGQLAETAGATLAGRVVQDRGRFAPATLIRLGKVEEVRAMAERSGARLAVFDEDLSPAQVKNLEAALPMRVVDRSTLILDIFVRRARSREAHTQVELARLRYLLPRLTRQWGHLSRQDGGIGQRGIGETQLELDRRVIRRKIASLSDDLRRIEKERSERRKGRRSERRVALVGYTNAGKSTILNLLTQAGALVEDRLFATLDPLVRRCERGGRPPFLVIDTVGFIRKLPHHLVASFRSTLEEAVDANLLLHVVDASSPAVEDHLKTTRDTLADLGLADNPRLLVFNKIDRVSAAVLERLHQDHPGAIFISAIDATQVDHLEERVRSALGDLVVEQTVSIPLTEPGTLAKLCAMVRVIHSAVVDGNFEVRFQTRPTERDRVSRLLRHLMPDLQAGTGKA